MVDEGLVGWARSVRLEREPDRRVLIKLAELAVDGRVLIRAQDLAGIFGYRALNSVREPLRQLWAAGLVDRIQKGKEGNLYILRSGGGISDP